MTIGFTGLGPEPAVFYRTRVLLAYSFVLFVLAAGWGAIHFMTGAIALGVLFMLCAGAIVTILVRLRRDHRVAKAAHYLLSAGVFATALATGLSGGLVATNVCPFFALIIVSIFLLGRAGLGWAVGSLAVAMGFQIAAWAGVTFPNTISPDGASLDKFLTWFSAAFVVLLFALSYENTRVKAIARLGRLNRALHESEAKYRLVVSHANDAIVIVQAGRIVFHNERAQQLTRCSRDQLQGRPFLDFLYPSDRPAAQERYEELLSGLQTSSVFRARLVDKLGNVLFVQGTSVILHWEGEPATLHLIDDITSRRQTEHALRRTEKSLRLAQRMDAIGRLAGGVAHDFNNYLTTILGAAETLDARLKDGEAPGSELEEIRQASGLAGTLTRQLLAFGRKQTLKPVVVQLNDVVAEMGTMLQRMVGEQVEVATVLRPGLGQVRLDPGQIEQVISNLAVNARDSMSRGGRLTIGTENVSFSEETAPQDRGGRAGRFVCLTVTDTGEGMDQETLEHVFEPFFTTKASGSGLGLAVVYGIVSQHEGWVSVESEPGRGSTFRVYLPAWEEAPAEVPASEPAPEGQRRRVLVVEDVPSILRYTANVLRKHDYEVFEARDADEAQQVYASEDGVDLLLTDVVLDGASGLDLARSLCSKDTSLRVLLSSGYNGRDLGRFGPGASDYPFIRKPYDPKRLLKAVGDALG